MHRFLLVFLLFCSLALADGILDAAEYLSASSALPLLGDTPIEGYFQQLSRIKAMESSRFMIGESRRRMLLASSVVRRIERGVTSARNFIARRVA
jgi:hypothetical protein